MTARVARVDAARTLRLRRTLDWEEVRWASVLQLLMRRRGCAFVDADRILKQFFRRLRTPFHPRWFFFPELSAEENSICQSICEAHGADGVILTRTIRVQGPGSVGYRLTLDLEPQLRHAPAAPRGTVRASCVVFVGQREMRISSPLAVLCIDVVALGLLGIFYALIAGAILYGIAVCVVFLREPLPTVVAATRNFPLGLGLLCALVSVGAFAGRCLRKLSATAKNLVRTTGSPFRGAAPDAHDVQSKSDG